MYSNQDHKQSAHRVYTPEDAERYIENQEEIPPVQKRITAEIYERLNTLEGMAFEANAYLQELNSAFAGPQKDEVVRGGFKEEDEEQGWFFAVNTRLLKLEHIQRECLEKLRKLRSL